MIPRHSVRRFYYGETLDTHISCLPSQLAPQAGVEDKVAISTLQWASKRIELVSDREGRLMEYEREETAFTTFGRYDTISLKWGGNHSSNPPRHSAVRLTPASSCSTLSGLALRFGREWDTSWEGADELDDCRLNFRKAIARLGLRWRTSICLAFSRSVRRYPVFDGISKYSHLGLASQASHLTLIQYFDRFAEDECAFSAQLKLRENLWNCS